MGMRWIFVLEIGDLAMLKGNLRDFWMVKRSDGNWAKLGELPDILQTCGFVDCFACEIPMFCGVEEFRSSSLTGDFGHKDFQIQVTT